MLMLDSPSNSRINIALGEADFTSFDPLAAKAAREADAQWRIRYQQILAEDHSVDPSWLARVRRIGASRLGRLLLGWLDDAFLLGAIHVVPLLWLIEEPFQKDHASSMAMFRATIRNFYFGRWYHLNGWVNPAGWFRRNPGVALAFGALTLVLSSPMLAVSLPIVAAGRVRDAIASRLERHRTAH